jgi:hypothetical protein
VFPSYRKIIVGFLTVWTFLVLSTLKDLLYRFVISLTFWDIFPICISQQALCSCNYYCFSFRIRHSIFSLACSIQKVSRVVVQTDMFTINIHARSGSETVAAVFVLLRIFEFKPVRYSRASTTSTYGTNQLIIRWVDENECLILPLFLFFLSRVRN